MVRATRILSRCSPNPTVAATSTVQCGAVRRYRVAFVNTHPIQYFAPLYAYLTRHSGIDVTALYLSDFSIRGSFDPGFGRSVKWDLDLLDGYSAEFMGKAVKRRHIGGFFSMVAPQLWSAIMHGGFDAVVVHGHNLAAHHLALAAARASGTLVFARGETHLGLSCPAWRELLRKPLLKTWYRAFDGCLAIGTRNRQYYEAMGVTASRIFSMPYVVDNDRFMRTSQSAKTKRGAIRSRFGIDGNAPAIIYAAKFDRRKRPADLIGAFHRLQLDGAIAYLVLVGAGPIERQLKAMVVERNIANVLFAGFVNQMELPEIYAACDVFVLPSENEPWGLAVNEAMCAGLPIVVSAEVGCAADLVENGVNGAIFEAGDVNALATVLGALVSDPSYRGRCSVASVRRIQQWSFENCAEGLRSAIEATRPNSKAGMRYAARSENAALD